MAGENIRLRIVCDEPVEATTWHFRTGVPFAKKQLTDGIAVTLFRDGREIPVQTEVLATWGPRGSELGKSVKWLGLDFVDSLAVGGEAAYLLHAGRRGAVAKGLTVREAADTITIDNGPLLLAFSKRTFNVFHSVARNGKPVIAPGAMRGAYVVDGEGNIFLAANDAAPEVRVEMQGALAAVVRAEGWFVNPDAKTEASPGDPKERPRGGFCRFVTRVYVAAGQPDVRVQHTFILTEDSERATLRDIGIGLPVAQGAKATYGGVKGEHEGHTYLLQKSWDRFEVNVVRRDGTPREIAEGQKAAGWVSAGAVAVGIRDFWQNFPKELELRNPQSELVVHLWPDHGAPRMETKETLNDDNVWRLPFVHSGGKLDFRIPQCLKEKESFPELHGGGYIDNLYESNAIGIAKTHDLLVSFDPAGFEARIAAFQANPHVLADPGHTAATRVFGRIPPCEPAKRPLTEHRYRESMKWIIRSKNAAGSFGMWNYGDLHTYLAMKRDRVWPKYRRLWAATHYNYPRVAWWLYWRSGDHAIGQHARREGRHIMDTDICHWTNELFSSRPTYDDRKAVGGLCDYKGVVHWHAGDRNAYNACIDFMLYDYYLTGNRRAWDVALEHGQHIVKTGEQNHGRGAAGQADTLVELYTATWDPKVGERLKWHVGRIMATPPEKHPGDKLDWTPWILRYWELTHDPAVKDYILHWVDGPASARMQLPAYAYYITGEKKYAVQCARYVFMNSVRTVVREDDYNGMYGRQMKPWADELTAGLLSLEAAEAVRLALADFQPKGEWPYWINWGLTIPYTLSKDTTQSYFKEEYPWPDDDRFRVTSYVYHDGKPRKLWLGIASMNPKLGADVRLFGPGGKLIKEVHRQDYNRVIRGQTGEGQTAIKKIWPRGQYPVENGHVIIGGKKYKMDGAQAILEIRPRKSPEDMFAMCGEAVVLDGDDPQGLYEVEHVGAFYLPVPILPPEGRLWIKVGKESTIGIGEVQYFYVPEDVEEFEMGFLPTYQRDRFRAKLRLAAGAILNPDCEAVASISCGLETKPQIVKVQVPPEHRGKTWGLAGRLFSIVHLKNVPPYISPSYATFQGEPRVPDVGTDR